MATRNANTYYPALSTGAAAQQELTSTGTANVQTFVVPTGAMAVYLAVQTNTCSITFDGSTPSTTNGLKIPAAVAPVFIATAGGPGPTGGVIKFVSMAAANSIVDALFVG